MAKKDWARKPSRNLPQGKRMLVVVEGEVTEKQYIGAVMRSRGIVKESLNVEHECTDPIGIVNRAKRLKKAAARTEKYDEVWCVFDTETKQTQPARPGLAQAISIASDAGVKHAISNPCFEIWLLWHREAQSAWIASHDVQRRCREIGITKEDGKHLAGPDALYRDDCGEARRRAQDADAKHQGDGTTAPEDRNPSSGVYRLIDAIEKAFPPRE